MTIRFHSPTWKRGWRAPLAAGTFALLVVAPLLADEEPRAARSRPTSSSRVESRGESRGHSNSAPPATSTRPSAPTPSSDGGRTRVDDVARGRRGGNVGHRGGFGHGYGYHYPYRYWSDFSWGWYGYWGWPGYVYYDGYWGDGPYGRYSRRGYAGRGYDEWGALDLDLSPGKTQIFLDGQFIGTADDFDGFPTFLWLEEGTYDLAFYYPGFQTLARQYSIYPGLVIDVEDRLQPGESVRPEDLPAKTHERRDTRLRYDREMAEEAERRARERADWRERAERYEAEEAEEAEESGADRGRRDVGRDTARVKFDISPGDASVYLDGRFVGTGDELARLRSGLIVDRGDHTLEIVRPGRQSHEQRLRVEPGEELEVEVDLEVVP